jgi:YbbR domain-containing protein
MAGLARLVEHWQLKVLAIAFAVGLWLFVGARDRTETVFTIPLDLTDRPAGLELASVGTETVSVRVEGRRAVLTRLREEDLRVEVSLRGAKAGRFTVRVLPANVVAPRGVRVVRVTPPQVRGTLETR